MDRTTGQWRFKEGDEMRSADDEKLGKVVGFWPDMISPTHLVIEGGFLFHHNYYVPVSAISTYDGHTIYINATKEQARQRGWDVPPAGAPPAEDMIGPA